MDFLRRTPQVVGYENTLVFYETREQWNALTTEWVLLVATVHFKEAGNTVPEHVVLPRAGTALLCLVGLPSMFWTNPSERRHACQLNLPARTLIACRWKVPIVLA